MIGHHWIQPTLFDVTGTDSTYPLTSIFYSKGAWRNTSVLITRSLSYMNSCRKPLKRLKCSPHQRQRDRSSTMIEKLMPFHWNQVTCSWLKPMFKEGGSKVKDWWEEELWEVEHQVAEGSLPTSWRINGQDAYESSTKTDFSSSLLQRRLLSVWLCVLRGPGAPLWP